MKECCVKSSHAVEEGEIEFQIKVFSSVSYCEILFNLYSPIRASNARPSSLCRRARSAQNERELFALMFTIYDTAVRVIHLLSTTSLLQIHFFAISKFSIQITWLVQIKTNKKTTLMCVVFVLVPPFVHSSREAVPFVGRHWIGKYAWCAATSAQESIIVFRWFWLVY